MASGNIRGITIEIGGDTRNLETALNSVNTQTKNLQTELKAVERGLKFDPGNVELVRQRQELLTQSINDTTQRLDILRQAQAQVQRQYDAGEIPIEQYRAFQRELQVTEGNLNRLQSSLNAIDGQQERLGQTTRSLGTFFQATGTDVEQFASVLGTRLTSAIRDGSASADQIERALRLMGQQALGSSVDVNQLRTALRQIDDGGSIQQVRQDLSRLAQEANDAGNAVNGFGDQLTQVAGGLAAGGGIAGVISQALDVSSLNTKIDITLALDEEGRESVREATRLLQAYGVEGEEALEGIRRQYALNTEASNEANNATIRAAGAIAAAYSDIDFKELIQETNEISAAFKITDDEALGLVNNLLRIGFPPDQLDIISEYGSQLARAGFTAEQIQATFAAGVDTETYNIDILLDGLQEGRLRLTAFTEGISKGALDLFKSVGISGDQLQDFGRRIAEGGEDGRLAYIEVAKAIEGITDASAREAAGIEIFGTLYEQNGALVTQTLINAENQVVSLDENQKILNETIARLDEDPAVLLSKAFSDLQTALAPVLEFVAQLIADFARFASENIQLVAIITAIGTVIGILAGAFVLLAPALGGIVTAFPALTAAFAAISAPVAIVVAAIVGLGAAFVALYQQSETFRNSVNAAFESIREVALQVFQVVADFIGQQLQKIQEFWRTNGEQILQAAQNVFNGIMAVVDFVMPAVLFVVETVWNAIKDVISGALDIIIGLIQVFAGVFTGDLDKAWEGAKNIFSGAIDFILGLMTLSFVGGIRTAVVNVGKNITKYITEAWTGARTIFRSGIDNVVSYVNGFKSTIINQFTQIKNGIVNAVTGIRLFEVGADVVRGLVNGIKSFASAPVDAVRDIGKKMISGISKVLGRQSPAKQFIAIGKDVDKGLELGISRNSGGVINAMEDIGRVIISVADKNAKEVSKIADEAEKKRTEIQKKYAEQRAKAAESYANSTARKAVDNSKKTAKQLEAANKSYSEKVQKANSARSKKLIEIDKKEKEELKKINDKAFADIEKKQLEVNKNTLDAIRNFIKNKKDLNEISLLDEANYYRAAYQQAVTGSEANIQLQRDYQNTVREINQSITTVNQDFLSRTQKINDDLIKSEEDLNNKYKTALDSRYNTLVSAYGLFDEVASQDLVDPTTLIQNLDAQVNALQRFQNSINTFRTRGISGALLEDLQNLGPRANAELEALNRLTDSELQRYAETYATRSRIARETAVKELEPLANDTEVQIQRLRDTANADLAALNTEWQAQIKKVIGGTEEQFKTLNQVGKNAAQNLLNGLTSVEPALLSKSRQIANDISRTISDALNINGAANLNLNTNLSTSTNNLKNAVSNAQASLNSSATQSNNNQIARTASAQSNNIDMNSLVAAIGNLASRPIQTAVQIDGRTVATSTSQYQNSNYNIAALQKGV